MVKMNSDVKIRVALVDIGECLQVNLGKFVKRLNSLQSSFIFSVATPVTAAKAGDPTVEHEWYEFKELFAILRSHSSHSQNDYVIGITHLKMTEREHRRASSTYWDYFSLSDFDKVAILSENGSVLQFKPPSKNRYQYLGFLLISELLILLSKHDMMHSVNNYCLFDDCTDGRDLTRSIKRGEICNMCLGILDSHYISQQMILDAKKILAWCRKDSMNYLISRTMLNPYTLLSLGAGLGWVAKSYIIPNQYPVVILFILFIPVLVFLHVRYMVK